MIFQFQAILRREKSCQNSVGRLVRLAKSVTIYLMELYQRREKTNLRNKMKFLKVILYRENFKFSEEYLLSQSLKFWCYNRGVVPTNIVYTCIDHLLQENCCKGIVLN